jgi:exosortase
MQQIFPRISPAPPGVESGGQSDAGTQAGRAAGWVVLLAIAILAVPTIIRFATTFWPKPDDTHAPLVLGGVLYGFWQERVHYTWAAGPVAVAVGFALALVGAAGYALGSSQDFYQCEGLGLVAFVCGCVLLITDRRALPRILPLGLLCLFVVPIPATLMDQALLPLKLTLTHGVVALFYALGFPIASHGVLISVGFYQLQIADACAGLRSLLALTAIGLLYVHFVPMRSRRIGLTLIALIPLIAVFTNFCRLSLLVLMTYYFGGDVSERAHGLAGLGEIALALLLFVAAHRALDRLSLIRAGT